MARPVKTEPGWFTLTMALFLFTEKFQPEMVPSRPSKRKLAEPDADPSETLKPVPLVLKTMPVGAPLVLLGPGTLTISGLPGGKGTPWPVYRVLVPVLLLATQNGPPGGATSPHGLTRF